MKIKNKIKKIEIHYDAFVLINEVSGEKKTKEGRQWVFRGEFFNYKYIRKTFTALEIS